MSKTGNIPTDDDLLLAQAVRFAADAHLGQTRKGGNTPFIVHPMEAAAIAATMTDDRHVIAAAVLHDVVEDTEVTADVIRDAFGDDVLSLVAGDTENKRAELDPAATWRIRKQETIDYVRDKASPRERIVVLSDKLANLRSMVRDYEAEGDAVWNKFHEKNPAAHAWYYRSVVRACTGLEDTAAYRECIRLTEQLFGEEK